MTSILIVPSTGVVKSLKAKDLTLDTLYKKCGFRNNDSFAERHRWTVSVTGVAHTVAVFAKDAGTANNENKYDLPPPVDKALYFGTLALVRFTSPTSHELADLTEAVWQQVYTTLFGGFEALDENEKSSDDEMDAVPANMKTENGYLRDGFVVDNDQDISQGTSSSSSEEAQSSADEEEKKPVRKRKQPATSSATPTPKKTPSAKKGSKKTPAEPPVRHVEQELREAAYVYSDDE